MLYTASNLFRLTETESNLQRIREILLCPNLEKILVEFISPLDENAYANSIDTIINNTFETELPEKNNGVTLMNKFVVLDNKWLFNNDLYTSGYRLIILIHEIGNISARKNCNSAKQCIEYDSDESSFKKLSWIKANKKNNPESGYQLEMEIFGCIIKELNRIAAEFLMDINNWFLCDFQRQFQQLNSQKIESDGTRMNSIRIRVDDNNSDFIDFRRNWCCTSFKRDNIRKII